MGLVRKVGGELVADDVHEARSFGQRLIGLLGRATVSRNEGLWFDRCSAIHTLGMRMAIDVIFVDAQWKVVRICPAVLPGCWYLGCATARCTIELGSGALSRVDVAIGDVLEFIPSAL